jgi:hypothetical protein
MWPQRVRPEIVRTGLHDLQVDEGADWHGSRHDHQPIHLWGVTASAADGDRLGLAGLVFRLAGGLDQDLQGLPHERLVLA